jgi:hypothetical protein
MPNTAYTFSVTLTKTYHITAHAKTEAEAREQVERLTPNQVSRRGEVVASRVVSVDLIE